MSSKKVAVLVAGELASGTTEVGQALGSLTGITVLNSESFFREIAAGFQESFQYLEKISKSGEVDLEKVLEGMAKDRLAEGSVIIEGRSALLAMDGGASLSVFLHKDMVDRKKFLASRRDIDEEEAAKELLASDQERSEIMRVRFNADWKDALLYDLTINTSKLTHQQAAHLIKAAMDATHA